MNIPNKVKIGGYIYDITKESGVCDPNYQKVYGHCDSTYLKISIDNQYPLLKQQQTFLHEVMHAIDELYTIGLKHNQIDQIASGLHSVIVDNPDIFRG